MTLRYTFQRGETITMAVVDTGAEAADAASVVAGIKPLLPGSYPAQPAPDSDPLAIFGTFFRPAFEAIGKGWDFELPAAQSAALTPGLYQFDITVTFPDGEKTTGGTAIITITEPASL